MNFEQALTKAKEGKKIYRKAWMAPNDFLIAPGSFLTVESSDVRQLPVLMMNWKGRGNPTYYTPSQADMFADDWEILEVMESSKFREKTTL